MLVLNPGLIGGLVLPVMGGGCIIGPSEDTLASTSLDLNNLLAAVPDGAIVLFSGLGADAQEQLNVGIGTLAGSSIMVRSEG